MHHAIIGLNGDCCNLLGVHFPPFHFGFIAGSRASASSRRRANHEQGHRSEDSRAKESIPDSGPRPAGYIQSFRLSANSSFPFESTQILAFPGQIFSTSHFVFTRVQGLNFGKMPEIPPTICAVSRNTFPRNSPHTESAKREFHSVKPGAFHTPYFNRCTFRIQRNCCFLASAEDDDA